MFTYLCNVVDFETKQYLKQNNFDRSQGKTFGNAFRNGMVKRLQQRFDEKCAEIIREQQGNALIRVNPYDLATRENNNYAYSQFRLTTGKTLGVNTGSSAYGAGYSAGGKVGLHGSRAITA
jgi:hypothetical protein